MLCLVHQLFSQRSGSEPNAPDRLSVRLARREDRCGDHRTLMRASGATAKGSMTPDYCVRPYSARSQAATRIRRCPGKAQTKRDKWRQPFLDHQGSRNIRLLPAFDRHAASCWLNQAPFSLLPGGFAHIQVVTRLSLAWHGQAKTLAHLPQLLGTDLL